MLVLVAVQCSSLSNGQEVRRCKNRPQTATNYITTQLENLQRSDIMRGATLVCAGLLALNVKRRVVVHLIPLAVDSHALCDMMPPLLPNDQRNNQPNKKQ